MYQLQISSAARNDLEDAYVWYEKQKKDLGNEFLKEVFSAIDLIEEKPFLFAVRFSGKFRFSKINRFPYLIVYETFSDKIIINAVFHTSRNPSHFKNINPSANVV